MGVLKYYLKLIWNFGFSFRCPCCKYSARQLLIRGQKTPVPIIGMGKRRAMCPRCNSAERQRLLQLWLNEDNYSSPTLGISPDKWLKVKGSYTTLDLEPGKTDITGDITSLPFSDKSFSTIICVHVLEHIPDDRKAMREIHRVLKPEGKAILQIPFGEKTIEDIDDGTEKDRSQKYGQGEHVRIYGLDDYLERLKETGFTVELYYHPEIKKYGLNSKEPLFVCSGT